MSTLPPEYDYRPDHYRVVLTQRLEALRLLRASGERRVRIGDREVEFRNDAELAEAIKGIEKQLAAMDGQQVRAVRFRTSKGL